MKTTIWIISLMLFILGILSGYNIGVYHEIQRCKEYVVNWEYYRVNEIKKRSEGFYYDTTLTINPRYINDVGIIDPPFDVLPPKEFR
jgi:hypothetical protein